MTGKNYPVTVMVDPLILIVYFFKAEVAGPTVTAPAVVKVDPWLGQTKLFEPALKLIAVPSCVQATCTAVNDPGVFPEASLTTITPLCTKDAPIVNKLVSRLTLKLTGT